MDNHSKGLTFLVVIGSFFLTATIGTDATYMSFDLRGVCVPPGDSIILQCNLRMAEDGNTELSFFHGSEPVDTARTQVLRYTAMCGRLDSSECAKWNLKARLEVHSASQSDEGVYWCKAVDNGQHYNASAEVFVQRQSEFQLPGDGRVTAKLGENVVVDLYRMCDMTAPVKVTKMSEDGPVAIPYKYSHEGYQFLYVDRQNGSLVFPSIHSTDAGTYIFTVEASRGYESVSTPKTLNITVSCDGCEEVPVTPTAKATPGQADDVPGGTATPDGSMLRGAENPSDNTVYIVVIVALCVCLIVSHFLVFLYHRRTHYSNRESGRERTDNANGETARLEAGLDETRVTEI